MKRKHELSGKVYHQRKKLRQAKKDFLTSKNNSLRFLKLKDVNAEDVTFAIRCLELTQEGDEPKIKQLLRQIDPDIAFWALKNQNMKLLKALLETVPPEDHLTVFSPDNNYEPVRQWIRQLLKEKPEELQGNALLELLVGVGSQIALVIREEINKFKASNVLSGGKKTNFQKCLETLGDKATKAAKKTSRCTIFQDRTNSLNNAPQEGKKSSCKVSFLLPNKGEN